jgi:hypothetical protein
MAGQAGALTSGYPAPGKHLKLDKRTSFFAAAEWSGVGLSRRLAEMSCLKDGFFACYL